MIQKQKGNSNPKYVSCIRINGKPILPPLITPHKKEELQDYKNKALDVESRIKERLYRKTIEPQCSTTTLEHQLSFADSSENNEVPCSNRECLNLTCDVVEISEYSSNGIRLFNDKLNVDDYKELCSSTFSEDHNKKDFNSTSFNEDCEIKPAPLIRSNSYTLESPSPVLLAHLKNMSLEASFGDDCMIPQNWIPPKNQNDQQQSNNCEKPKESALILENNIHIDCEAERQYLFKENELDPAKAASTASSPELVDKSQTEIDTELLNILNKLSSKDKEQILLLLKLQEQGQVDLNSETLIAIRSPQNNNSPICTDSCSQTPCLPREDAHSVLTQTSQFSEMKIDFLDASEDNLLKEKVVNNTIVRNILNCSKNLFSEDDVWLQQRLRQEWAASVIAAHVKGYLTRRLMATERVRTLIETIKDALICAMQLHAEATENIDESDVELHRRLVQQISAACYAFHDIFFSLTAAEKMAIIAHDRRKLKEKALKNSTSN